MEKKIIPFKQLPARLSELRKKKKNFSVILCHGCFDIVHPGHIRHLKFAREQGDFLIVSITPDVCIQKGSSRPQVPEDLRAENLAALEIVNAVTVAPGETAMEPIKKIKPDVYVKGREYALSHDPRFLEEKQLVEKQGGKVAYSSGDVIFSSSELIRDNELHTADAVKLNFICKRYEIGRSAMNEIIKSAGRKKFLIIGESILDEYKYCEGIGIAQESPVLSISLKNKSRFVGASGATALHLAGLGAEVTFLTSMDMQSEGSDVFSYTLDDAGASLVNVEDRQRPLVIKSHYFVDRNQVLELENGKYRPLDSSLRSHIIKQFKKEISSRPDGVILSDFGYGLFTEDLVREMTEIAHSQKTMLISDITMTLRTHLEKFFSSDIFVASEMELRSCMHDYESGISVIVHRFYSNSSVKELYLTLNDGSSLYFKRPVKPGIQNMESAHIPSLTIHHKDRMGTGEAFLAGIALARVSGANEVQSIYAGSIFSSVTSRAMGNNPINREELYRILDERAELV